MTTEPNDAGLWPGLFRMAQKERDDARQQVAALEARLALVEQERDGFRRGLEKIANSDWRIISGSVGPLMDVGYGMAGQFAVAMAEEALNPTRSVPASAEE